MSDVVNNPEANKIIQQNIFHNYNEEVAGTTNSDENGGAQAGTSSTNPFIGTQEGALRQLGISREYFKESDSTAAPLKRKSSFILLVLKFHVLT